MKPKLLTALSACAITVSTHAGPTSPTVWSWDEPLGTEISGVNQMILMSVIGTANVHRTGTTMADLVCKEIQERTLGTGEVAILFFGFAQGDRPGDAWENVVALTYHKDDALADDSYKWRLELTRNGSMLIVKEIICTRRK